MKKLPEILLTASAILLFFFLLPGLAAGTGSALVIYIDGLRELPPLALKVASADIGMLFFSYLLCLGLKFDKEFIRDPLKLTIIGIVLIPLQIGAVSLFSEPSEFRPADLISHLKLYMESMIKLFIEVVPLLLCSLSVIILAWNLTILIKKTLLKSA
ncbi:hypothetical protein [Dickeya sp. NCPPB 3274]|uniref:hypothetical protein n=1 Tax=Dickeya sp. NCPPB 3274 TaxID=568766 RepID=UPI0005B41F9C|nr:hypothetical protein [Dickeya sp. NCPPB 3274]